MWLENPIFREDMEYIAGVDFVPWEKLRGKTLFITQLSHHENNANP